MSSASSLPPLSRLYREHFADVWIAVRRLGVPDASLEDAVHDVFMVVHRRREDFEGRSTIRTWLLGIARRIAFRYRRTAARTERRHRALQTVVPVELDPETQVARREGLAALHRFLESLDRRQRDAFVLGELECLNRRELGEALGVSPNTAYSRLRAARARFSETFNPPHSHHVLAMGRRSTPPPRQSRQRVWLALSSGLGGTTGTTAGATATATVAWYAKSITVAAGLAAVMIGGVVAAADTRSEPPREVQGVSASERPSPKVAAQPELESETKPEPIVESTPPVAMPPVVEVQSTTTEKRRSAASRSRQIPTSAPRAAEPSLAPEAVEAEVVLLRKARSALARSQPALALEPLEEHRRRFPNGMLAEERDASLIRVHCATGRGARARRDAQRFASAFPGSAYLDALADTCVRDVIKSPRAGDPGE